jgi:hypothetical protein
MWLLLRQDTTDEGVGVLVRRGGGVAVPQVLRVDRRGAASSEQPHYAHLARAPG